MRGLPLMAAFACPLSMGCSVDVSPGLHGTPSDDWCSANCAFTNASTTCAEVTRDCAILHCKQGYADCDGTPSNGCEADLRSDPGNCGDCSNSCGDTGCREGSCWPVTIHVEGRPNPAGIAVGPEGIVWVDSGAGGDDGTVNWLSLAGGSPSRLAEGQGAPLGIARLGTQVFWTCSGDAPGYYEATGSIRSISTSGGAITTLADGLARPYSIATDGVHVAWTSWGTYGNPDGTISVVGLDGQPATVVASGQEFPRSIFIADGSVYWSGPHVHRIPVTGGQPEDLAPDSIAWGLALDKDELYWPDDDGTMRRLPLGGGEPEAIGIWRDRPRAIYEDVGIFVADGFAYLRDYAGGRLIRISIPTGDVTLLAGGQGSPASMAIYNGRIYWTVSDVGKVMSMAIPPHI